MINHNLNISFREPTRQALVGELIHLSPTAEVIAGGTINTPSIPTFGAYGSSTANYPNDVVQLDLYNAADRYLESDFGVSGVTKRAETVFIDVERNLTDLGYTSGVYSVEYRFLRNFLGSGAGHRLRIQEVSADGLEIRVVPILQPNVSNEQFVNFFATGFFNIPKAQALSNLLVFKDTLTSVRVFDYVLDRFTFPDHPHSIILKLESSASDTLSVGDSVWVAQEVSDRLVDTITMVPPKTGTTSRRIAGPDWDVDSRHRTNISTPYRDWDDLVSADPTTSQGIVSTMFSGSVVEGIKLNTDFRRFENFIHFGSATERLKNFKYKLQLIESYDARLSSLTTGLDGLPSSSVSASIHFLSNVQTTTSQREQLLGNMDTYEHYLFYQSSSYETSSYGEFYPTTWPKYTTIKPHSNYSVTSSQAQEWFLGMEASASLFDQNNPHSLYHTIPGHILDQPSNEDYSMLVNMVGHYFDLIYAYIRGISDLKSREQSIYEGFGKDLIFHVAQSLGINLENGASTQELWEYVLGTEISGSYSSQYQVTSEERTKEIWKRLVNNLPYLLRTRGTERGLRAIINCFGIPSTILRIREYGGAEPTFESKTDWTFDRFAYATRVGYAGGVAGDVNQKVAFNWGQLPNGLYPRTVEFRVKMAASQSKDQQILSGPDWDIIAFHDGDIPKLRITVGSDQAEMTSSIYKGEPLHLSITNSSLIDGGTELITLQERGVRYNKITTRNSVVCFSRNGAGGWAVGGDTYIPSAQSFTAAESASMAVLSGSVQELRFWTTLLQPSILDNHALSPTSFQGNLPTSHSGSTSSFETLAFRLSLGGDARKIDHSITSSVLSQHPNQRLTTWWSTSQTLSGSFKNFTTNSMEPIVESYSQEWPDLGGNRSVSNKIRLDNTILAGDNQLHRNNSVLRSLIDSNPPDSPRLGVYLSPTNEVDQDIAEQFGGLSIDDFIGDPTYSALNHYPGLGELRREYYKKYTNRNNGQNYIRLIKHFDSALFQLIKQFVPYRANTQVGLVIEPTLLDRSKLPSAQISWEENHYSSSIAILDNPVVGGFVQDGDGEPFRDMQGYVQPGVIDLSMGIVSGFVQDGDGEPFRNMEGYVEAAAISASLSFPIVDYNYIADGELLVGPTFNNPTNIEGNATGSADLGISSYGRDVRVLGSQYQFMTYMTSGSGPSRSEPYLVTASRYDYHEPLGVVVTEGRRSQISNDGYRSHDSDIFGNLAFGKFINRTNTGSYTAHLTSSYGLQLDPWTARYGLHLNNLDYAAVGLAPPWVLTSGSASDILGLATHQGTGFNGSDSFIHTHIGIDAFFYRANDPMTHDLMYQVDLDAIRQDDIYNNSTLDLHFGSETSPSASWVGEVPIIGVSESIASFRPGQRFISRADGSQLVLRLALETLPTNWWSIPSLRVTCLNYRADVQDFHLHDSRGMVNARYDGCKMSSADWNVDSPDTVDGGPVVSFIIGGGTDLVTRPSSRGTFEVRGTTAGNPTSTTSGTTTLSNQAR